MRMVTSHLTVSEEEIIVRCQSSYQDIQSSQVAVQQTTNPKPKPDNNTLVFGKDFTDHALMIEWTVTDGWAAPQIMPFGQLSLSPAASALHYGLECFEGMKAYRGVDDKVRLFRPMENMTRMNNSAARASLPVRYDKNNKQRLQLWPTILAQQIMQKSNITASLWLFGDDHQQLSPPGRTCDTYMTSLDYSKCYGIFGDDHQVTEVGTMNMFMLWINEQGEKELITPPLNGLILPGVTRSSLLALGRKWDEFKVTEKEFNMGDLTKAVDENRVLEMFGSGTACVVCPINRIFYQGKNIMIPTMENLSVAKRLYDELTGIQ
ncbi:hypothetical protein QZH41_012704, partial [Actinostola sp. cb2023]